MRRLIGLLIMIVCLMIFVSGCFWNSQNQSQNQSQSQNEAVPVATAGAVIESAEPKSAEPKKEDVKTDVTNVVLDSDYIKNLLLKSTKLEGYSYDLKVMLGTIETNSTVYNSRHKNKIVTKTAGKEMITISNGDTTLTYEPDTKKGYRYKDKSENLSPVLNEETINKLEFKYVDVEDIGDMHCLVVQWVDEGKITKRAWIHEEYGVVVKMHSQTQGVSVDYSVSNLKVLAIADSEFIVPSDIVITDVG